MIECKKYEGLNKTQYKFLKEQYKNIEKENKEIFYNIGAKYFTFTVINYVLWIIQKAKEDKIDIICFMARDGYIIKKCYDLYFELVDSNIPESKYLYSSRSIFYNSAIVDKADWTDKLLYDLPYGQTIESYFIRWNIKKEIYLELLKKEKIAKEYIVQDEKGKKIIKDLYFKLRTIIIEQAEKKRKILKEYWESESLIKKNIAFVDIGWNGTCQSCIEKIVDIEKIDIKINFYFLGTLATDKSVKMNPKIYKGCFFSLGDPEIISSIIFQGIPIIESFFSAPVPYILDLKKVDNKILPVYDNVKNLNNIEYMNLMHEGVINQIVEIFNNKNKIDIVKDFNLYPLMKLIKYPKKSEVCAISKFKSSVTFGTEKYNVNIICKVRILFLLRNRKYVKKIYDETLWKFGFNKINSFIVKILLK